MGSVSATSDPVLSVEGLHARRAGDAVLGGVEISIGHGEVRALIGPPSSGIGALAKVLLGDPAYEVTAGRILLEGEDVTFLAPDTRAKLGMFLAFARPAPMPGAAEYELLRRASAARHGRDVSAVEIRSEVETWRERLGMDPGAPAEALGEGSSDAERTEHEMLQMALFEPRIAIVDRTGGPSDRDATTVLRRALSEVRRCRPEMGVLVVGEEPRLARELGAGSLQRFASGRTTTEELVP